MQPTHPTRDFEERPPVDPAVFRKLTRLRPWKSMLLIGAIYAAAVALAYLGGRGSGWLLAVPAILVIGALQNHLLILLHEGAHYMIHPNRRRNDLLTDALCAVPLLNLTKNYRSLHLDHHKHSGHPGKDPEIEVYRSQDFVYRRRGIRPLLAMFAKDLFGWNMALGLGKLAEVLKRRTQAGVLEPMNGRDGLVFAGVWLVLIGGSAALGAWVELLVFWILPQATVLIFLLKLHGYGEHTGASGPTEFQRTWHHAFGPVTNFFIYPIKSGFHLEHHLFAGVPWYHMAEFRRELLKNPHYAAKAEPVTVDGFFFGRRTILGEMLLERGSSPVVVSAGRRPS